MSELKPEFIYFDLDDTLLDHKKAEQNGLRDVHQHFSELKEVTIDKLLSTYHIINKGLWEQYGRGQIDRHILHRRRFEETFIQLGVNSELYEEAGKVYMNYYRNHWEWIDGAESAFDNIRDKYSVGLITNGFAETQWKKIHQFELEKKVEEIIISEEIGVMKPHQKIFDHGTELAGVTRDKILYVGDSLISDVRGGKSAGWKVAWFTTNPNQEGRALADLVFDDFEDLINKLK